MRRVMILAAWAGIASASTIGLFSSAANTSNDSGSPTIAINRFPAWAAAMTGSNWISYGPTGDPTAPGYFVVPNGTTINFFQSFNIDGPVTAASLSVMADDTTSVIINGVTIYSATNLGDGGYPLCSTQPIGCLATTRKDFDFATLNASFRTGVNMITLGVVQKNGVSFGLDYAGSITTTSAPLSTPEPVVSALIAAGLVGIGLRWRFRRGGIN